MLGGLPRRFEIGGASLLLMYAVRFFLQAQLFTNHNYLFLLLGALAVISGGGNDARRSI